ncbi:kinase-like domain-containing protein [Naematelia encephala]|uniref:non-specific serine/threonine protein kinase n=1 Tax=Naematelia encephala TaxID=71784 RepID=A0A1Y2BG08_9TREE|nr:kinase-like domain-containing protein [Naematelia encephala]
MAAPAPRKSAVSGAVSTVWADVSELDNYKLVSNIGKGSFGVISKVQRIEDGKEFALKQLDYSKMTEKDRKQILAEVAILESLKHRNIVQLVQKIKDIKNERIYIVMEYCTSGDLSAIIRKAQRSGQTISEDRIWNIFLQIVLALHHCHWPAERSIPGQKGGRPSAGTSQAAEGIARYQVLHRDLKPENVFLSDDFVKLGDFGLSKDMGTASFTSTYVGTPLYMPPEILGENRYDTKSDIWSLGCLVFEMCALTSPFSTAQTQTELITMVKSGKLPPLPAHISPALKSVIRAMLNLNPVKRPSTKDLLEMDEMKLHRKLFTVQNQTTLLITKRDDLKRFEEQLLAKAAELQERDAAIAARESTYQARETMLAKREEEVKAREEEARDTHTKLNLAAETLRVQWDKLRGEKEKEQENIGLGLPGIDDKARRPSLAPSRPPLEERNTLPLAAAPRFPRNQYAAYDDTPSKIPMATALASPLPLGNLTNMPPPAATPLRRNNTKSLGNLAAEARAQAARSAEATPAKQITNAFPVRSIKRTSIGSPSEARAVYYEDISMASASPMSYASPAPFIPRPRRSSIAPEGGLLAGPSTLPASESSSSTDSMGSEASSGPEMAKYVPPTMIPAPTFLYREHATPAKWSAEDPDLPSPFLRRGSSMVTAPAFNNPAPRQPLGTIDLQTTISAPTVPNKSKGMPRSRSGNLHQHVLRANAQAAVGGRTSGETMTASSAARARAAAVGREAQRMMGM